ncbi:MAG: RsmE family RNA methyltransferase [Verrucomicrobiota bacterium]|jgi:16S rRNA (uracil1498-N3)-methyltransferase
MSGALIHFIMPDFRSYYSPTKSDTTTLILNAEESHHLVVVNRAEAGDPVIAFNGKGTEWICTLIKSDKKAAHLNVISVTTASALPFSITLAQALPKGTHMDDIVRKATELGVTCIIPINTERTQVKLESDRSERKIEKWQNASLEAAKQCGNPWLPEITGLQEIKSVVESAQKYDLCLIASLEKSSVSLKLVLSLFEKKSGRSPKTVLWLIGPEGDFTPEELAYAKQHGFESVTLGPLVLRCETAAISAISILGYELQNRS